MSGIAAIIGNRLRNYRHGLGLSQEKLAEMAGLHPTYIGQVERGEKNLTIESLFKLCAALKLPLPTLFECIELPPVPSHDVSESTPQKCYRLVHGMNPQTQERDYLILCELFDALNDERRV